MLEGIIGFIALIAGMILGYLVKQWVKGNI